MTSNTKTTFNRRTSRRHIHLNSSIIRRPKTRSTTSRLSRNCGQSRFSGIVPLMAHFERPRLFLLLFEVTFDRAVCVSSRRVQNQSNRCFLGYIIKPLVYRPYAAIPLPFVSRVVWTFENYDHFQPSLNFQINKRNTFMLQL